MKKNEAPSSARIPPYFDFLIEDFLSGNAGRCVHLGYWPESTKRDLNFSQAQAALDVFMLDKAELKPQMQVLDVGCGFGSTLAAVDSRISNASLVGVNIDSRQLDICKSLVSSRNNAMSWAQADACELPFAETTFERVFCIEAMFHFSSRQGFFEQAARVLRPSGLLLMTDLVVTPALHRAVAEGQIPGFCIEAALVQGYGPWPDFWGDEAGHETLANQVGLTRLATGDISQQTLRSYEVTVPPGLTNFRDPGNSLLSAAMTLRWLHQRGFIRYVWGVFEKG